MENQENVLTLKKPIMIDGEEKTIITYNFDELTGENLENGFKSAIKSGYMVGASYELDPVIGAHMFAEAAGIDYTDVKRMGFADYNKAASLARDFFIQNLGGDQEENN
ncbi:phage tail assembly protein [Clostridium botulinum]|nr:phage tail assembly protein [Clostridium botulinum]NFO15175.1 phage tail assembly protein [Clostridium botulinum]